MLTVAIPTYNRAHTLPTLMESILGQLTDEIRCKVKILISDNASTDDTADVVRNYQARTSTVIIYFRNATNLGYSQNVNLAVERTDTEFVLLMSDDDALEENSLPSLLAVLSRHRDDTSLIFSSVVPYDKDLIVCKGDVNRGGEEEVFYRNGCDYLRAARSFPPALLSGYVIRKDDWINYGYASTHVKSIIIHMLVALEMCLIGRGVVLSGVRLVKYRQDGVSTSATFDLQPLYPFRFWLDCLQGRKDMIARCPTDIGRLLYAVAMRSIIFYLARQKVVKHPFDAHAFWTWLSRVQDNLSVYTLIAHVIRWLPVCVLRKLFGRFIDRYPIV